MSNLALDSAIRATAQKTIIEIHSDDSDDSDIDMNSESDRESDATNTYKKVPDSSDASSSKSRLISPITTATTGSSSLAASQHSQPSSVSHSIVEDSPSEAEDLTQILKAVRRARAQEASEEQLVPEPVSPLPDLSTEIRAAFGDHFKGTSNFFIIEQPSRSIAHQPETSSENRTRSAVDGVSKRKALYDPFAEDLLNIEDTAKFGPKKKRRRDGKKRDCLPTNSQAACSNTRQQGSGHDSTRTAFQDTQGQSHGHSCFEQTPAADARSSRALSLGVELPIRPRSASVDPAGMKHGRCKGNLNRLVRSRRTDLSTFDRQQPSRPAHEPPPSSRKVIIDLDEDDGHDPVRLPDIHRVGAESNTQPIQVSKRQRVKNIEVTQNRTGSGIQSFHDGRRRSPATRNQFRDVSAGISQAQPDDLQGRIGGLPERRPAYARKETSHLDKVIKQARRRQLDSGRVTKSKTLHEPPSQQPRASTNRADEARLLKAQETSTWRAAPVQSAGKGSQISRDLPSGFHSELTAKSGSAPLFRPNKNAYAFQQSMFGDDEDDDSDQGLDQVRVQPSHNLERNVDHQPFLGVDGVEDEGEVGDADPPQSSGERSAYLPNRISRLPIRPSSQSNGNSIHQPVRSGNSRIAEHQRRHAGTKASKASHQTQLPVEDWDQTAKQMAALIKQYEDKPRALVVNALPSSFGVSDPAEIRQHNKILDRERAKIRNNCSNAEKQRGKAISRRKAAIRRDVREKFKHMPERIQNEEFERRFNAYLEKHHPDRSQPPDNTVHRDVQFDENFLENEHSDHEVDNHPDDDLNRRMIPAAEALRRFEPRTRMTIFTVFVSEPHDEGESDPKFKINKSFDKLTEASKHARSILDKSVALLGTDYESKTIDGFTTGRWRLPTGIHKGKWKSVKTQEEETCVVELPPDALRDKFVDEELIDKYARDAYDVFFSRTAPQDHWEAEAQGENNAALCKRQGGNSRGRERKRKGILGEQAANSADDSEETPASFEGDELRRALAAGPTGTCQTTALQEESIADGEDPASDDTSQSSDDSESSEGTVCAPPRAGLSYNQIRGNAYSGLITKTEALGTFTTMREANKTALNAARLLWKPRTPDMNANIMYTDEVLPYIERQEEKNVHSEGLRLVLPGLASATGRDLRSWGFTCSEIHVQKRDLQGPVNLAIDFVLTARDRKQAACASEKADKAADDMGQAVVEGEEHGEMIAQAAVEGEEDRMGQIVTEIEQHGEMNAAPVAESADGEDRTGQGHEVVEGFDQEMPDREPSDESDVSEEE